MKYLIPLTLLFCAMFLSAEIVQAHASLKWNKYDFVPGEKRILEENQEGEVNGEFPSRRDFAGGIRLDVNQATIRPESVGTINSIYGLLKDHPELNLSVEGHTDIDGDEAMNQTLSGKRAQAVTDQLISLGIDGSHLTSKGLGENKPVAVNNTAEGKAANSIVEFVKN